MADKEVENGKDVILSCEANTDGLTANWEKDGQKLYCVQGKHTMEQTSCLFVLQINKAQEEDKIIIPV